MKRSALRGPSVAALVSAIAVGVTMALAPVGGAVPLATPTSGMASARAAVGEMPTADCTIGPLAACADADLSGRVLSGANLTGATLTSARLDGADLSGADLAEADASLSSGVEVDLDRANLRDATFVSANLASATLRRTTAQHLDASWASLTGADLTGGTVTDASLRSVMASRARFSFADLTGTDLTGANLAYADLRGTVLTGATLRQAWLAGATVDARTDLTGADLTGATWIDGSVCAAGSIGICVPEAEPTPDAPDAVDPGAGAESPWKAVISGGLKIGELLYKCAQNEKKTGNCFESDQEAQFKAIRAAVDSLSKQLDANHAATMQAFNIVIQNQKDQDVKAAYARVKEDLADTRTATRKYQELLACTAHLSDSAIPCVLTDMVGNDPQTLDVKTVDDLYAGASGPITYEMATAGPVARLLFATLWQFGGKSAYAPTNLVEVGMRLQRNIAGDKARPQDGLLYSNFAYLNAELNTVQRATPGTGPAFLPGSYLARMNSLTDYYVGGEAEYFAAAIAALGLRDRVEAPVTFARTLYGQALNGTANEPQFALGSQSSVYRFPLDGAYGVSSPDRVGFFVGANGALYRVETVGGATDRVTNPGFAFPSYSDLVLLQNTLSRAGVRISIVQSLYSGTVPGGQSAAWWASFGSSYAEIPLQNAYGVPIKSYRVTGYSCSQAPDYGIWDKVATRRSAPCIIPVRMWDTKPTIERSYEKDRSSGTIRPDPKPFNDFKTGIFTVVKSSGTMHIWSSARRMFDTVVTGGAAPAYDLSEYSAKSGYVRWTDISGSGVLYRPGGTVNTRVASNVATSYVSIRVMPVEGLFTKLATGPVRFDTCEELRSAEWRGIGEPTAHDRVTAGLTADDLGFDARDNLHRWDEDWYEVNAHLDVDHDGVACELTQERSADN
ncbi:MAG: hypothetical protein QG671_968 [Actinomycetota bacterium]|nr:hypothetical protein [Actinomycetota bacterium]